MVRPPGPEQGEFHLDVREARGEEEEAQEKDVVEGHVWGGDLSPREGRRLANHPDQAGSRREGDPARNGPGANILAVFLDEERYSRGQEEDARVEERPDLEADGDEAPSRYAVEEGSLRVPEDIVSPQEGDRAHDVRVHSGSVHHPCEESSGKSHRNRITYSPWRGVDGAGASGPLSGAMELPLLLDGTRAPS